MLSGKTQKSIKILPEVLFLRDFGVYLFKSSTGQQYKPKSVIRPKQACYKRICLSFSLFSERCNLLKTKTKLSENLMTDLG